jgi:hypothetical protein
MTSPPADAIGRDALLGASDERVLAACRVECVTGSGPGGQKRNRCAATIRLTHPPTGIRVVAGDSRHQSENRRMAVRRMRHELALHWRCPPPARWDGPWCPADRSPDRPRWVAVLLDVLEASGYRVADAAAAFGVSTGRLVRDCSRDPGLWQQINRGRQKAGIGPLHRD